VVAGASATAADTEIVQLPEDEDRVVLPHEEAGEGVQARAVGGDVVDGDDGSQRWLLAWSHQLLKCTHGL
jgi:hypothetical protein